MARPEKASVNFFTVLRDKLEIEPDRNFDQRFWAAFEQENPRSRAKIGLSLFSWIFANFAQPSRWAPLALILIAALGIYRYEIRSSTSPGLATRAFVQDKDFFENTDLFLSLDEFTSMTDDDWAVLLENT